MAWHLTCPGWPTLQHGQLSHPTHATISEVTWPKYSQSYDGSGLQLLYLLTLKTNSSNHVLCTSSAHQRYRMRRNWVLSFQLSRSWNKTSTAQPGFHIHYSKQANKHTTWSDIVAYIVMEYNRKNGKELHFYAYKISQSAIWHTPLQYGNRASATPYLSTFLIMPSLYQARSQW